jgi:hypothetical protein
VLGLMLGNWGLELESCGGGGGGGEARSSMGVWGAVGGDRVESDGFEIEGWY